MVCEFYGLEFNNITEIELALDSDYNYIGKVRRMIRDIDRYDLILNGRRVTNDETLDGYGEYYSRSRVQLSKMPTLYLSQAKSQRETTRLCQVSIIQVLSGSYKPDHQIAVRIVIVSTC